MNNAPGSIQTDIKSDSLDVIRSETALSRYPIHRLANKGTISINIRKKDERGLVSLLWEVDYSNKHGQPGPLAYKLDSLVINRRIDEAGRPVPKVLQLGSLRDIAAELDLGGSTNAVRNALRQNAFAGISAKITYKTIDKTERTLEADFTRYSIVFTGEKLPDGRKADAVHLVLNDIYMEVLNNAIRRPLDYDYLRALPPAPQRFYEILSYEMLPAIRYNQRAKLPYSEFCMYSTMTRYFDFDHVKKQMWKIHQPHLKAGYLATIEYETTTDDEGHLDWNMFYTPGERAKFQQLVFSFALEMPTHRRERPKRSPTPKPEKPQAAPLAQLPLPAEVPNPNTEALTLVKCFYRLRYGQDKQPSARELEQAAALLTEGPEWAAYLVDRAARYGKEQAKGFPENFGGVGGMAPRFREEFDAERQKQQAALLRKARQSHEEARRGAYHAFLGELLGGKLETSLPEAFAAFIAQEQSTYQFHKVRAAKSAMSANTIEAYYTPEARITRLLDFIARHPKSGLPSFWQWDEKMNPNPFRPAV